MEAGAQSAEGTAPRTTAGIDFLLLVDEKRARARCALRKAGVRSCAKKASSASRPWSTPKLLSAAEHVMEEKDTEEDLRLLFAPDHRSAARARKHRHRKGRPSGDCEVSAQDD